MAKAKSIPDFTSPVTKRAIITGAVATALGVVVVVPVYNKVIAPAFRTITDQVRAAGFLPRA